MARRPVLAAALAVAACALAACGDDGPSREEFASEANKVCRDIERESQDLGAAQPDSLREISSFAQKAERTVTRGVDRLEGIERPSGDDGKKADEFVRQLSREVDEQLIPALRELRTAAGKRDVKGIRSAAERLQSVDTKRSDELARELGANACAE